MKGDIWAQWQAWTAIYAALVATVVLALEVRRWFESGVRLAIHVMPNACVLDGKTVVEGRYLLVTVSNRGDRPATITHFAIVEYAGTWGLQWLRRACRRQTNFWLVQDPRLSEHHPPAIPVVLHPGQLWQGFADWHLMDSLMAGTRRKLFVAIYASDSRRYRVRRISVVNLIDPQARTLEEEARGDFAHSP